MTDQNDASDARPVSSEPQNSADLAAPATGERVAKVISRSGAASRRDAEKMILAGRVTVNGKTIDSPALDVTPADKVAIDGKPIDAPQETRVWVYYKPLGLVTTEKDEQGRRTIFDEMPPEMPRVLNVGRLDLNSEGLLLLTNDGGLKRRLELPETAWLRKYRVRVNGRPTDETFEPLRRGATIDGEDFLPMEITLDRQQGANAWLTVGLREGRNREIRRAMTEIGLTVNRLIRVSYGPFRLNDMQPGDIVELKRRVLRDQLGDALLTGVAPKGADGKPRRVARTSRREDEADRRPARFGDRAAPARGERGEDGARGFGRQKDFSRGAAPDAPRKPRFSKDGDSFRRDGDRPRRDGEGFRKAGARPEGDEGRTGGFKGKPRAEGFRSHRDDAPARGPRPERGERPERANRSERNDRPSYGDRPRTDRFRADRAVADNPKGGYARPWERQGDETQGDRPRRDKGEFRSAGFKSHGGAGKPRAEGMKSHRAAGGDDRGFKPRRPREDSTEGPRRDGGFKSAPRRPREDGDRPARPPRSEGGPARPERAGAKGDFKGPRRGDQDGAPRGARPQGGPGGSFRGGPGKGGFKGGAGKPGFGKGGFNKGGPRKGDR